MKKLLIFFAVFLFADVVTNSNINVLRSLNIEDEFLFNPALKKKFKEYSQRKKRYYLNILENGFEILPVIKEKIISSKIPQELVAVAMAESYFSMSAKSHKKAIGLWQFMPSTAKRFGLRIDEYVDERKDPVKSTEAAIDYLKYLHDFFGKWYLAIMAYNAGEARTVEGVVRAKVDKLCKSLGRKCRKDKKIKEYRKIIKSYQRHGKRSFSKLYALYKKLSYIDVSLNELLRFQKGLKRQYFPKETRNYILKVVALSFLLNSNEFLKYSNSYVLNSGVTSNFNRVFVPPGTSLYAVAKLLDMRYSDIKRNNMHLRYAFTPPYKYYIYIPYQKLAFFKENFKGKSRYIYIYRVKKGDTLLKIAKMFDTKVKVLKDYNKLGKYLHIGDKIIIPLNERFIKYVVKPGDSLLKIARKFGISYKKIKRVNNLNSSIIRVGQVLKIPQKLR